MSNKCPFVYHKIWVIIMAAIGVGAFILWSVYVVLYIIKES